MNVYRRFFKITTGEVIAEAKRIVAINSGAKKEYSKFLKKIGASEEYYERDQRLVGIISLQEPDRYLFKKIRHGWWLKKNTKKGKELNKQLKAIKTIPENNLLRMIGLDTEPVLFTFGRCYYSSIVIVPLDSPLVLVNTPWFDEDPQVIKEYSSGKKDGSYRGRNLDVLLWAPPSELEEIKEWQYKKLITEYNESIKELVGGTTS